MGGYLKYKVDVPVDGKYLREALFKKFVLIKKHNTNFAFCYGVQNKYFYFENREYF